MYQSKQTKLRLYLENEEEDFRVEQIHIDGICIYGKC